MRALLVIAGIEFDDGQLHQFLEQTDGWVAGLRLATLSMSQTMDPDRFLAKFAANDRAVAAYLIDEVLSRLPTEMSEFLRTISVCDHMPGRAGRTAVRPGRRPARHDRRADLTGLPGGRGAAQLPRVRPSSLAPCMPTSCARTPSAPRA